jgi:hypothetical protein
MTGGNQTIDNCIHDIAVGGEKLTASGRDFDSDPVVRLEQRTPRARDIGLVRDREDKRIGHSPDDLGIGLIIVDRARVMRAVNDRRRGCRRRQVLGGCADDAEEEKSD